MAVSQKPGEVTQGRISPRTIFMPSLSVRVKLTTNKLIEAGLLGKHGLSIFSTFERAKHIYLICFDHNFDHLHINVVAFVPRKESKKSRFFPQKQFFC